MARVKLDSTVDEGTLFDERTLSDNENASISDRSNRKNNRDL